MMALAFHHTFGVPVVITRCSNNYGPYQFPEKLIPLMIINSLNDKKLPVYGDGMNVRDWIYEVYNIGASTEMPNIKIVKMILKELGKSEDVIEFVRDRPGHDRRYAIDSSKVKNELGWTGQFNFEDAISQTIKWYIDNKNWWSRIISGKYQEYYKTQYGK